MRSLWIPPLPPTFPQLAWCVSFKEAMLTDAILISSFCPDTGPEIGQTAATAIDLGGDENDDQPFINSCHKQQRASHHQQRDIEAATIDDREIKSERKEMICSVTSKSNISANCLTRASEYSSVLNSRVSI